MSAPRSTPSLRPLAAALALCGSCVAQADPLEDTFALNIGAFILSTNTTVRADGSPGPGLPVEVGTPINVERQLGIGDQTMNTRSCAVSSTSSRVRSAFTN